MENFYRAGQEEVSSDVTSAALPRGGVSESYGNATARSGRASLARRQRTGELVDRVRCGRTRHVAFGVFRESPLVLPKIA
jgi:hypothetical protein